MNIVDATKSYEAWLSKELRILPKDLEQKHAYMKQAVFPFLRATYYRWAQIWTENAEKLAKTPVVLAVGDLHVENFGTWGDAEGRLVWGVNDFDEAAALPLAIDLTRLAVSVYLASQHHSLGITRALAARVLLQGYHDAVESGGRPFVLEESHPTLRHIASERLKDPAAFWTKLTQLPEFKGRKPKTALCLLMRLLPHGVESLRVVHRMAGLGSLGRQRLTAIAQFDGGFIAREVKQLAPPASYWATRQGSRQIRYGEILKNSVRCGDPFLRQQNNWIGRRLSPSNSRVEISELPKERDVERLLHAMGFETANLHLGSLGRKKLRRTLDGIKATDLARASKTLENAVVRDWKEWRAH